MGMTRVDYSYDSTAYYRARYYDPSIGRFISEDPIGFGGNGANFYAYAGNDPVDRVDPSGCGFIDCAAAMAELEDALKDLFQREVENAAGKCDKGHPKAIEQFKNRARNALQRASKCLSAETVQQIADAINGVSSMVNTTLQWLQNLPLPTLPPIGPPPLPIPLPPIPIPL